MIARRHWSAGVLGTLALPGLAGAAAAESTAAVGANILRVSFGAAETGFDPPRVNDLYSRSVTAHIFESLYRYDPLAMPVKIRPLTAVALPEVSADFRVWTIRLQRGIFFADDPAFKGPDGRQRPRELVAQDYAYAFKRFFDPAMKSPLYSKLNDEGIEGLDELRQAALKRNKPFDYDAPLEGLRTIDRYTLQLRLRAPRPRFLLNMCDSSGFGAVAREVVEFYGDNIMAHPVGTGPYRLKEWRRSSRIVLERNPAFRELRYDAEPNADDAQGQAWLARFKGRRLPFNDGVEIVVLEEEQTRWLSFLNGQIDLVGVPLAFASLAVPNDQLAPNLARRGITVRRYMNPDFTFAWFNMEDPVVGGYSAQKVALRRAIGLAYNTDREIRIIRRGQAVPAQAAMQPGTFGYDPNFKSENSSYDPARANALLDLYGYAGRDGDGWRQQPDGSALLLRMASQASQVERQFSENWQKSLQAVGLRIVFTVAQWPENMKAARAGALQMWSLGDTASVPDAQGALEYMYGPSIGGANLARFKLPAFDVLYERALALPNSAERAALFIEASKLATAYMPYKIQAHRVATDLSQPWITGWRKGLFRNEAWQFVEIDPGMRERLTR